MPKKKDKLVLEDLTAFQDKWATGISGRSVGPKQMTLLDLLGRSSSDEQHPNNIQAQGPDIYGSQLMEELLGDLFIQAQKVREALTIAKKSPVIKDRHSAQAQINKIIKKAAIIQKVVSSMGEDVGEFRVEKPEK